MTVGAWWALGQAQGERTVLLGIKRPFGSLRATGTFRAWCALRQVRDRLSRATKERPFARVWPNGEIRLNGV